MPDLEQTVAELVRRVRALEDELAIHRHLVRYGFAVDTGDAERTAALFAGDSTTEVDGGRLVLRGRQGVRDLVLGSRHQAMLPNTAHQIGPAVVELDGDHAVATGYSRVYQRIDDGFAIYRVSFNRWELERRTGAWTIVRRTTRLLGSTEAGTLLRAR